MKGVRLRMTSGEDEEAWAAARQPSSLVASGAGSRQQQSRPRANGASLVEGEGTEKFLID